jgi:2-oxoglutarate ferredoxin oxidoreductase subunit gamma
MRIDPYNVRLSGKGGQGILLAGIILAEAGMKDGLNVAQSQTYGPQARLGASKSEVILSSRPIAFPEVETPNLWLCLSVEAFEKHGAAMCSGGLLLLDERVAREKGNDGAVVLPIIATAIALGDVIAANIVALGSMAGLTGIVTQASLEGAVAERVKISFRELNLKALRAGYDLAEKHLIGGHGGSFPADEVGLRFSTAFDRLP